MTKLKTSPRELIFLITVVVLSFFLFQTCESNKSLKQNAKRNQLIAEQNKRALTDSLRTERNKVGELESVKSSFLASVNDLKTLNADLYQELKREIGNVKSLIKTQVLIEREPVTISNELVTYPDKSFGLKFHDKYSDDALTWTISGQSKFKLESGVVYPGSTTINQNSIKVKLVMGFKENKDNFEVWARSGSPMVKFGELDGVLLIPKKADITCPTVRKKRFGLGPFAGVGVGIDFKPRFVIGAGITYDLLQF